MIKWIRTSRLSINNSFSGGSSGAATSGDVCVGSNGHTRRKRSHGGLLFSSPGNSSISYLVSHHRSVGYRERRCGFNTKHQSTTFCTSPPPNLDLGSLTSRAHVCLAPALTAKAVLPAPRSTEGRFVPISARRKRIKSEDNGRHERCNCGARWARTIGIVAPAEGVA